MRRRQPIMTDWLFTKEGVKQSVDLPHTWNSIDGCDGGNDYFRGLCSYEKILNIPDFDEAKELVFIEFLGVNSTANVYLNDQLLITHKGGYSTFVVEATPYLKDTNRLFIEVDNSVNNEVYPQKADFTFYGGIYRDVNWLIVNKNHFDITTNGTPGLHVTPVLNGDCSADVSCRVYPCLNVAKDPVSDIDNDNTKDSSITAADDFVITFSIIDQDKNIISQISSNPDDKSSAVDCCFHLDSPHLWQAKDDPYLYTMVCALSNGIEVIDEVSTSFGIRSIKVDPKKGFFLNSKPYPLRGVSRHQDRKGYGNAISYEMMAEDMALIKEVGANCIRLAHYQHSQYFYDLCDKEGMIVWAEIPYISGYLSDGDENTHSQMTELIVQNYNHPSIVTWGLSNEITINYTTSFGANLKNHKSLNNLVHQLDPSRPTSIACFAMCTPFHPVTRIPDIIGWNLYLGWYVPGFFLNDLFMSFFHLIRPNMALGYSEYGAEGMPNLHSDRPKRGDNTEEYQAIYHEYMLKCFDRHPYLWSTFVWNMFDFAADARDQGGEPGMNHKGLVTYDRKIKKDSFYLYKAYWSNEPFVHICGKRFIYHNKEDITLKVYTNQTTVSLYSDNQLITIKTGSHVFEFKIKIADATKIKVISGDCIDTATFTYTKEPHPEYTLRKDNTKSTANWM